MKKNKYLSDEEIEKQLKGIHTMQFKNEVERIKSDTRLYNKINKLLKIRMNGAEQYDKYREEVEPLKDYVIWYERKYLGGK
jgi:hypothetical protein